MGFYGRFVIPRLINLAMQNKDASHLREIWVPRASGDVLEIGSGSGLNLRFYSSNVHRVYGIEPSPKLVEMARKRAAAPGSPHTEFFEQSAEAPAPLPDESIDTAVSTWTLCSIPDAVAALRQVHRVLKPTGSFIFVEHGRAAEAGVVRWQDRLNPCWKPVCGGCNLNRKIDELIRSAGFEITEMKNEYLPGPRPMTYTYEGIARKA